MLMREREREREREISRLVMMAGGLVIVEVRTRYQTMRKKKPLRWKDVGILRAD